jgi:hypothetical protein
MSTPKIETPQPKPADKTPPPDVEKRRYPRLETGLRCWIGSQRHTLYVRLHDVSRGGLSVRARVPFIPATTIEVGLELPGGSRLRARGEVVWVRDEPAPDSGAHMGARFVEFLEGEGELDAVLSHP